MKRIDIIEKLVAEGFSVNTLVKFNDNQLHKLSTKLLGEGLKVKADDIKSDPALADKLKDKDVTIVPESEESKFVSCSSIGVKFAGMCEKNTKKPVDSCAKMGVKTPGYCYVGDKTPVKHKASTSVNVKNLNEFVENIVDKQYHSLATKGEIVSLIKERVTAPKNNITEKLQGKLPEFMSFDNIVSAAEPQTKPDPKSPDTIPSRPSEPKISPDQNPRKRPFRNPNEEPAVQPKPKAKVRKINNPASMPMAAE
jgi:hypothetical protein